MRTYAHIFYVNFYDATPNQQHGWYYAFGCDPGCLPESDPVGPFGNERFAEAEARAEMNEQGYAEVDHMTFQHDGIEEAVMFGPEDVPDETPDINEVPGDREPLFDANRLDCQPEAFDPDIYGPF